MTTIKFQLLHADAKLPARATEHAAAFDVVAVSREVKDGYVTYGLGFSTEIPRGWQAKCYARSSISNTDLMLCNSVGIIDADYRGEWSYRFKVFFSTSGHTTVAANELVCYPVQKNLYRLYEIGDRIGQIQFERVPEMHFEVVESLSITERGAGGYGSTGHA